MTFRLDISLSREQAAQCVLDALKKDLITVGQARKLLIEDIGWQPGPAHKEILESIRISVLQSVTPAKKPSSVSAPAKERKSA
jgi:hypothetical protein